jgi:23S rRNA (guanine745-N1)-methyltransferase
MVDARERFLTAGHYSPIAEAVTAAARPLVDGPGCVADLGAGTGYHLAALLQELAEARGIALDASRPALRRAARAHPRIAAVACDVWQRLPIQDGAVDLILDVFAPRNGVEIARVLAPHGALIVVTPTPDHLRELVSTLGLLDVDADKEARVRAGLSPLTPVDRHDVEFDMTLGHDDVEALIAMGPSAHHVNADDVRRRVAELPGDLRVTASVTVQTFRRPA